MLFLFAYTFLLFFFAYKTGSSRPSLRLWSAIDAVYYPLAAAGVLLFFVSRDLQRDLLRVSQEAEKARTTLQVIKSKQPGGDSSVSERVFDAHLEHLNTFEEWAEICSSAYYVNPAKCGVNDDLRPHLERFRQATSRRFKSFHERALATCDAADAMSQAIVRADSSMPFLPADSFKELIALLSHSNAHYGYDPEKLDNSVNSFVSRAKEETRKTLALIYKPGSPDAELHLSLSDEATEQGAIIARSFYPCFILPKEKIRTFRDWSNQAQQQTTAAVALEKQRARLKEQGFRNYSASWAELNVWPFVIIFALSLKFAKAVASLRKDRMAGR